MPEGTDEIEDVLGDHEVAIVVLGVENRAVALGEVELGERELERSGRHLEQGVEGDQEGELRGVSGDVVECSIFMKRVERSPHRGNLWSCSLDFRLVFV